MIGSLLWTIPVDFQLHKRTKYSQEVTLVVPSFGNVGTDRGYSEIAARDGIVDESLVGTRQQEAREICRHHTKRSQS
jgi:hypothetical protein